MWPAELRSAPQANEAGEPKSARLILFARSTGRRTRHGIPRLGAGTNRIPYTLPVAIGPNRSRPTDDLVNQGGVDPLIQKTRNHVCYSIPEQAFRVHIDWHRRVDPAALIKLLRRERTNLGQPEP